MKKTNWVILLFSLVSFALAFNQQKWVHNEIFKYDASGYYLYLPAIFIYQDLGKMEFYKNIDSIYKPSDGIKEYGLYHQSKTNLMANKYAVGTAIGELPAFLLMHVYTKYYKTNYPADGYSMPYHFSVAVSNIIWSIIGMIVLAGFLRHFFSDFIVASTLMMIGFGTNLFCYTGMEMGLSHTLEFMLFTCVLYYTHRWYKYQNRKDVVLLGIFLGWVLITRPVDFLIVLVPIFWPLGIDNRQIHTKGRFLWGNRKQLFTGAIACLLVTSIQLGYWKYATAHFIHFSYEEEGFNFRNPEIINGLFSYRKGWFIFTPIALIALLGLIPLYVQQKKLVLPILLFIIPFIYVVFSWNKWWYGWGFGARPMIESYALLSLPLAALLFWLNQQKRSLKFAGFMMFTFFIALNIFQTRQYRHGLIDGEFGTKESYFKAWEKSFSDKGINNK